MSRAAFRYRGSAFAGFVIRSAFARASRVLPIRRVAETRHVLAFHHPVPGFEPVHLLLVPKFAVRSVLQLSRVQREQVATDVEQLAPECLVKLGVAESGFLVLANGGARQDVRQVHFHLVTCGFELAGAPSELPDGVWTDIPDPAGELHQVRAGSRPLLAGLTHASEMHDSLRVERRGYSVVWDAGNPALKGVVHLTAGMRATSP